MSELIDALDQLEKEKNISKDYIIDSIEKSIYVACQKDFGKDAEFSVSMNRETGDIQVFTKKHVVDDDVTYGKDEITLKDARMIDPNINPDDEITVETSTREFGRIAAQSARNIIIQAIKESEKKSSLDKYLEKKGHIINGIVQRIQDNNIRISLDEKTETVLSRKEMIPGDEFRVGDRVKVYVLDVKEEPKFKIIVTRTHPFFVYRLFEREVTEISEGIVEVRSIAREAGSRTKMAVYSTDENIDAVGACVGLNGTRVNNVVSEMNGEKIDIIEWDENPAIFIEHSLSPSKVVSVEVDLDEKSAKVVVPDYQLSLAIGKEGQNARLAAKLTGYKIDIKSESQEEELERLEAEGYEEEEYEEIEEAEDIEADDVEEAAEDIEAVEEPVEAVEETAEEEVTDEADDAEADAESDEK